MNRANVGSRGEARFPETSWGLVLATREGDSGRDALASLCRRYWMPIYACLRRQGFSAADAEDRVQGFFLHLIERDTVGRADPARGRFRSFLLGALRWFLANEREQQHAGKRGGHGIFVSIDIAEVEASLRADSGEAGSLDLQFDRQWACTLVRNAVDSLRDEYVASGQAHAYEALQSCLDPSAGAVSYADLAGQLGCSAGALKVAVHRLRGRFRVVLRREVALTVAGEREVDDELAYLRDVLAAIPAPAALT